MNALLQTRLDGFAPAGVDLVWHGADAVYLRDDALWVDVGITDATRFDYRGLAGMDVYIHAAYAEGLPFFTLAMDYAPRLMVLCCDVPLRYEGGKVSEWI
jgi:hypothetical protein